MSKMTDSFAGLPVGQLICTPIVEVAKGQAALCDVYLNTLYRLAYKDGKKGGEANLIKFKLERPVTDGKGNMSKQTVEVNAPLLSLVPVPAFTMDEATVDFTMQVTQTKAQSKDNTTEAGMEAGASFWGAHVSVHGSVTNKSHSERTNTSTGEYKIHARAVQQPPSEGMAKLTSLFASVIEPVNAGSGGK